VRGGENRKVTRSDEGVSEGKMKVGRRGQWKIRDERETMVFEVRYTVKMEGDRKGRER